MTTLVIYPRKNFWHVKTSNAKVPPLLRDWKACHQSEGCIRLEVMLRGQNPGCNVIVSSKSGDPCPECGAILSSYYSWETKLGKYVRLICRKGCRKRLSVLSRCNPGCKIVYGEEA